MDYDNIQEIISPAPSYMELSPVKFQNETQLLPPPIYEQYEHCYQPTILYYPPAIPAKIMIPSANNPHEHILVNHRQAARIQIMRNKRRKRMQQMLALGIDVDPKIGGSRYTMSRKKDRSR